MSGQLLYSMDEGMSALYNLASDPGQSNNVILDNLEEARELHQCLVRFMRETNVPSGLLKLPLELRT